MKFRRAFSHLNGRSQLCKAVEGFIVEQCILCIVREYAYSS